VKVAACITRTHNPFGEDCRASCLRENLTSSSYGEGLETGRESARAPRQSFTRQVFFKMAKSFLNLARECQGRSYDGLVAHATLVCCRYIMLALAKRVNQDPRTIGTLFHACCEELKQATFTEALALVFVFLELALGLTTGVARELIRSLIDRFLRELPPFYREQWPLSCQNKTACC